MVNKESKPGLLSGFAFNKAREEIMLAFKKLYPKSQKLKTETLLKQKSEKL